MHPTSSAVQHVKQQFIFLTQIKSWYTWLCPFSIRPHCFTYLQPQCFLQHLTSWRVVRVILCTKEASYSWEAFCKSFGWKSAAITICWYILDIVNSSTTRMSKWCALLQVKKRLRVGNCWCSTTGLLWLLTLSSTEALLGRCTGLRERIWSAAHQPLRASYSLPQACVPPQQSFCRGERADHVWTTDFILEGSKLGKHSVAFTVWRWCLSN